MVCGLQVTFQLAGQTQGVPMYPLQEPAGRRNLTQHSEAPAQSNTVCPCLAYAYATTAHAIDKYIGAAQVQPQTSTIHVTVHPAMHPLKSMHLA